MADTPLQVTGSHTKQEEAPSIVEVLEDAAKRGVAAVQDYSLLSFRSLTNLATSPHYFQDTLDQMDDVGVGSLPIILLSGFVDALGMTEANTGADGVIQKSAHELPHLIRMVTRLLNRKPSPAASRKPVSPESPPKAKRKTV